MRSIRLLAVLCAGLMILPGALHAAGYANSGIGMRAMGMGNAFRAVANDWTAAYYNPAGYATIYDNQLGANVAFIHLRNELIPNYKLGGTYETGVYNDQVNYNHHEILNNPSGGFVVRLPVWGESVFGFSIYQPFDHNVTWQLYSPLPAYNDSTSVPGDQFSTNLDVVAFQVTMARQFMDEKLSLGLGLQLLRADLLFTNLYFRDNPYGPPLSNRPYEKITQYANNNGNGYGFGINAGALWHLSDNFQVAFTARVPFDITVDGGASLRFYMPKNNSLWQNSDSAAIANPGTPGQLFLSGKTVKDTAQFETKVQLPPSLGIGFAYNISENFTLAMDAEITFWSQVDGFFFNYSDHQGLTGPADTAATARDFFTADLSNPVDWEDGVSLMLGASYDAAAYLTLLAGASMDYREVSSLSYLIPGVQSDQSDNVDEEAYFPQLSSQKDRYTLNAGVIFHINQWDLGLVGTYNKYPDLTHPTISEEDGGRTPVSFAGDLKSQTFETVMSFIYRF